MTAPSGGVTCISDAVFVFVFEYLHLAFCVCVLRTGPQYYEGHIIQRRETDHDVSIDKNTNTATNQITHTKKCKMAFYAK